MVRLQTAKCDTALAAIRDSLRSSVSVKRPLRILVCAGEAGVGLYICNIRSSLIHPRIVPQCRPTCATDRVKAQISALWLFEPKQQASTQPLHPQCYCYRVSQCTVTVSVVGTATHAQTPCYLCILRDCMCVSVKTRADLPSENDQTKYIKFYSTHWRRIQGKRSPHPLAP